VPPWGVPVSGWMTCPSVSTPPRLDPLAEQRQQGPSSDTSTQHGQPPGVGPMVEAALDIGLHQIPLSSVLQSEGEVSDRIQRSASGAIAAPALQTILRRDCRHQLRTGLWGFPGSSTSLFLHAAACGLWRTCPSSPLRLCACCLRERSNPRRPLPALSKRYQHFRVRGHPYGLQDARSTLRPSCSSCVQPRLRRGRKTRYGWVARPYPTRTFTLQETPSFLGAITPGLRRGE